MDLSKIRTEEDVKRATLEIPGYTVFDSMVYAATFRIPRGKVSTYGRVARMIGKPKAYRAVAHSLHRNPLFPVVACHRVVKEDGSFGGDAVQLLEDARIARKKEYLLQREKS